MSSSLSCLVTTFQVSGIRVSHRASFMFWMPVSPIEKHGDISETLTTCHREELKPAMPCHFRCCHVVQLAEERHSAGRLKRRWVLATAMVTFCCTPAFCWHLLTLAATLAASTCCSHA